MLLATKAAPATEEADSVSSVEEDEASTSFSCSAASEQVAILAIHDCCLANMLQFRKADKSKNRETKMKQIFRTRALDLLDIAVNRIFLTEPFTHTAGPLL